MYWNLLTPALFFFFYTLCNFNEIITPVLQHYKKYYTDCITKWLYTYHWFQLSCTERKLIRQCNTYNLSLNIDMVICHWTLSKVFFSLLSTWRYNIFNVCYNTFAIAKLHVTTLKVKMFENKSISSDTNTCLYWKQQK